MEDILNGVSGLRAMSLAEEESNPDLETVLTHLLNTEVFHVQVLHLKQLIVIQIIVQLMENILNGVSGRYARLLVEEGNNQGLENVPTQLHSTEVFHVQVMQL
jgi:translation initiation factor RLI1